MKTHTTIDLDLDLVREAARVLGTRRTTETVHAALAEAVAIRRRLGLLDLEPALTLDSLAWDRAGRFSPER